MRRYCGMMERFVQALVLGGLALLAGLWLTEFRGARSTPWIVGIGLAGLGLVGLLVGIVSELDALRT